MQTLPWPARTARGGLSLLLAGLWWLLDRLYGDQLFAAIKPVIPTSLQALEPALAVAFSYGPPSILIALGAYFIATARQLALITVGQLIAVDRPNSGGGFILIPIRARPGRTMECRVVMELTHPDGSYAYPQYVLLSEQALMRKERRVGRVNIDDVPKRFELFDYDCGRGLLHIRHEAGDASVPARDFRIQIIVAGAGPAKSKQFHLQKNGLALRISDGSAKSVRELAGPEPLLTEDQKRAALRNHPGFIPTAAAPSLTPRALARELDDFYAEATRERNRIIPSLPDFDYADERAKLVAWKGQVLQRLNVEYVTVKEYSDFRTLGDFAGWAHAAPNKTMQQDHIEAMWNECRARLKAIIDRLGS